MKNNFFEVVGRTTVKYNCDIVISVDELKNFQLPKKDIQDYDGENIRVIVYGTEDKKAMIVDYKIEDEEIIYYERVVQGSYEQIADYI